MGGLSGGPPDLGLTTGLGPGGPVRVRSRRRRVSWRSIAVAAASTIVVFSAPRLGHRQLARLARVPGVLPQRGDLLGHAPRPHRGVLGQRPAVPDRRGPHPRLRARPGRPAEPARPGLLPGPAAGDVLRRPVPGAAGHPRHLHARVRDPGPRDRRRAGRPVLLGRSSRSPSSTRRTSPRSTGPASTRSTRARRPPPARSASRAPSRCGTSSCPQAVRRVIPPLLNDFIGLQKDTVLVSFIGVVEIFRTAQIKQMATFNFTPYLAVALVFIVVTFPLARVVGLARRPRPVAGRGGRAMTGDAGRGAPDRGPAQVVRRPRGPARHRPRRRRARGHLPHRRLGLRQVDAPAVHQPHRGDRRRADRRRAARRSPRPRSTSTGSGGGSASSSRPSTCSPT